MSEGLPLDIRVLAEKQAGDVVRTPPERMRAIRQCKTLHISQNSQFGRFIAKYCVCTFASSHSNENLLDIAEPTAQIATASKFIHECWEVSKTFLAISPPEGEGCLVYSLADKTVANFSLQAGLRNGWANYFEFIRWYLGNGR